MSWCAKGFNVNDNLKFSGCPANYSWGYTSSLTLGFRSFTAWCKFTRLHTWEFSFALIMSLCFIAIDDWPGLEEIMFPWMQSLPCRIFPYNNMIFIAFINLTIWRQYWYYLYNIFITPGDAFAVPHVLGTVKNWQYDALSHSYLRNEWLNKWILRKDSC